jgi:tetratricopeptide (TPR) repeat protein
MKRNLYHTLIFLLLAGVAIPVQAQKKNKKSKSEATVAPVENGAFKTDSKTLEEQALFIDAVKARIIGDIDGAAEQYKAILKTYPKNHAAAYELSRIYYEKEAYDIAERYAVSAIKNYPYNEWYYLYLAEIRASKGDFAGAAKSYESLLNYFPKQYDYYYDWAYMLMQSPTPLSAISVLDKLEKLIGPQEDIILEKHDIYAKAGKLEEAAAEVKKLIKNNPKESGYYGILGSLYESFGKFDKAKEAYEELLKENPENADAKFILAGVYKKEGNVIRYNEMVNGIFKDPKIELDTKVQYMIPKLQYLDENDPVAVKEVEELTDLLLEQYPNDIKALTIKADFLFTIDNKDAAIAAYKKALESPEEAPLQVWLQLFNLLGEKEDYQSLSDAAAQSIVKNPNEGVCYFYKGFAAYQLKNYAEAAETMKEGLDKNIPTSALKGQMLTTMGDSYNEIKEYSKSDSAYEKALELDPNNAYVLNNYAYYLSLRNENLAKAEKMSKKSNLLEEGNAAFMDTYAWIMYQRKNYTDALKWIEKAINATRQGSKAELYDHYGDILFRLGKVEEAVAQWKNALEDGGNADTLTPKIKAKKIIE